MGMSPSLKLTRTPLESISDEMVEGKRGAIVGGTSLSPELLGVSIRRLQLTWSVSPSRFSTGQAADTPPFLQIGKLRPSQVTYLLS